jgi:Zn-dependent M28 family amino/carboxypeptidase
VLVLHHVVVAAPRGGRALDEERKKKESSNIPTKKATKKESKATKKASKALKASKDLRKAVTIENIMDHLQVFKDFADDSDGERADGTRGFDLSQQYIAGLLSNAGFQVTVQDYTLYLSESLGPSVLRIDSTDGKDYEEEIDFFPMFYTPDGTASADTQLVPNLGCDTSDFEDFEAGKIAVISRGDCFFDDKAAYAEAAGAVGAIIFNDAERLEVFQGSLSPNTVTIPVFGTSYAVGQELTANEVVQVTMIANTTIRSVASMNVLADSPYGNEDQIVMAGGHVDTWAGSPGVNDNGSGNAALLAVILSMYALGIETENKIRLGFWSGGVSSGGGSFEYVFGAEPPADMDSIVAYLNFDIIVRMRHACSLHGISPVQPHMLHLSSFQFRALPTLCVLSMGQPRPQRSCWPTCSSPTLIPRILPSFPLVTRILQEPFPRIPQLSRSMAFHPLDFLLESTTSLPNSRLRSRPQSLVASPESTLIPAGRKNVMTLTTLTSRFLTKCQMQSLMLF